MKNIPVIPVPPVLKKIPVCPVSLLLTLAVVPVVAEKSWR
jgi:hypothetical protein